MSDTGKFKPEDGLTELQRRAELERKGVGRIEYDDTGDPVWMPASALSAAEVMKRLLDDDGLAISEDDGPGTVKRIQPNPGGLKKGYDPYDSGVLAKKTWKKNKDLRALSQWIEAGKKPGEDESGR